MYSLTQTTQPHYDVPISKPASSSVYYSDPDKPFIRDRPKLASNDYEGISDVHQYHSLLQAYHDDPVQHSHDVTVSQSITYDEPKVSTSLSLRDDEVIYSDPGHSEKAIYYYFESKKFRIINESAIK